MAQADPEPFFTEPRKHLVWFVYRRFGVKLEAVREVFVDATFGTNSLGAHLYCILGQENGWFVPLAYMLLEARQQEKTNDSSPEVTESVTHMFASALLYGFILSRHLIYEFTLFCTLTWCIQFIVLRPHDTWLSRII
jgi:hypothetical protein